MRFGFGLNMKLDMKIDFQFCITWWLSFFETPSSSVINSCQWSRWEDFPILYNFNVGHLKIFSLDHGDNWPSTLTILIVKHLENFPSVEQFYNFEISSSSLHIFQSLWDIWLIIPTKLKYGTSSTSTSFEHEKWWLEEEVTNL